MLGFCPQATLPKLGSQFFGAGFGRLWVVKILARISGGDIIVVHWQPNNWQQTKRA
jgi:hypothetical protein